jgi:hypothetical protein
VVTEFEFRLHDVGTRALSVELDFPAGEALPAVVRWRDLSASYWKGHYFRELSPGAIEGLLATDPGVRAGLQAYGGAIADVPGEETAVKAVYDPDNVFHLNQNIPPALPS